MICVVSSAKRNCFSFCWMLAHHGITRWQNISYGLFQKKSKQKRVGSGWFVTLPFLEIPEKTKLQDPCGNSTLFFIVPTFSKFHFFFIDNITRDCQQITCHVSQILSIKQNHRTCLPHSLWTISIKMDRIPTQIK